MAAPPPHPMVPVPQALETVLTETARSMWHRRDENKCMAVSSHDHLVGRISAVDVKAPSPGYPDHNSSIMDGYAVKTSELVEAREAYDALDSNGNEEYGLDFFIAGKVYAGDDVEASSGDAPSASMRTAMYITTGAVVPDGYDAVIPVEETTEQEINGVHTMRIIPTKTESVLNTKPWTWIRTIGIDIPPASVVLAKGEVIQPVHLALLGQVGISLDEVYVKRLPRVGVLSTGNELISLSDRPSAQGQGKIPDVNRPLLLSQLSAYGNCTPVDLGIVKDDDGYESIARKLNERLWPAEGEGIDVLITTGGISMGEKDIMERVFVEGMGGRVHFGRMNMKPGKPTTFITIDRDAGGRKLVFALPGNPVSASVCTELLVRPCLDLLHQGAGIEEEEEHSNADSFVKDVARNARVHEEVMAAITTDIKLDQGRPEYRRVALQRAQTESGDKQQYAYHATSTGVQRSSRVLSLRGADGLMMLPRGGASGCGYDVARKGMEYPVLMQTSSQQTRFKDSMHRATWKPKHHRHHHHSKSGAKLSLGVIVCVSSDELVARHDIQSTATTLVNALGGEDKVSELKRSFCVVPHHSAGESVANQLAVIANGPSMDGTNVIFVIVPTDPSAEDKGSSAIAFRAGLEVSHALSSIITKNAPAMAQQVRKHAAACDPVAALFENVVGTVRETLRL